ncbi:MAG: hypothetical protein JWM77_3509 [Rhodospirillales bacterium]|nr:hypothetical protein [Rhodospirillales bacterium]
MEFVTSETLGLLVAAALFAGFVDAIAGGGGLIAVPALLWAGLPPAMAIGTNKAQAVFGTSSAVLTFHRRGHLDIRDAGAAVAATAIGAALGGWALRLIDASLLAGIIPVLLIGVALLFLFGPRLSDEDARSRLSMAAFAGTLAPAIGFYDGFFGPGAGSFFTIAFVVLRGYGLRRATANAKLLNLTSNLVSLIVLAESGQVIWTIGLSMAVSQLVGGWLGSRAAIHFGANLIRPMLIVVSLSMTGKLLANEHHPIRLWFDRQVVQRTAS